MLFDEDCLVSCACLSRADAVVGRLIVEDEFGEDGRFLTLWRLKGSCSLDLWCLVLHSKCA